MHTAIERIRYPGDCAIAVPRRTRSRLGFVVGDVAACGDPMPVVQADARKAAGADVQT